MKQLFKFGYIVPMFCFFILASCSKKSADLAATTSTSTATTTAASGDTLLSNMIAGKWIISSYAQRTEDKTSQFNGFVFTFSTDGSVTATKSGTVVSGTWSHTSSSVGYYGAAPSKASVTFNFGTTQPFSRLTRIWNLVSSSASNLALVNPEPAEGENLQFSRQ